MNWNPFKSRPVTPEDPQEAYDRLVKEMAVYPRDTVLCCTVCGHTSIVLVESQEEYRAAHNNPYLCLGCRGRIKGFEILAKKWINEVLDAREGKLP